MAWHASALPRHHGPPRDSAATSAAPQLTVNGIPALRTASAEVWSLTSFAARHQEEQRREFRQRAADRRRACDVQFPTAPGPCTSKPRKRDSRREKYVGCDLSQMANSESKLLLEDGREVGGDMLRKETGNE
ncbi:hypothetical protein B0H17DRAFT_538109 [Mycena rosella]|uniref:Uncharacterized protein n=1 Tax=Mycena rosella TaxID=1033263 RepID=A0AAD7BV44_MYCRO|nr:hypothetical protein B0H17DRAFT_538109 [Mycena rosella]